MARPRFTEQAPAQVRRLGGMGRSLFGLCLLACLAPPTFGSEPLSGGFAGPTEAPRSADFGRELPTSDARFLAQWIAVSRDNRGSEFVVVDKRDARLYVFDAQSRLRASSPVLLGAARGDDTVPGIGERPLAEVRPEERTTPAGRFLAERGRNAAAEDVVWIDYDAAVSIHRVRSSQAHERRLERLATPTPDDNRISYGCINVPVAFYEEFIRPLFAARGGLVYVLPEVRNVAEVFGAYDVSERQAALGRGSAETSRQPPKVPGR